MTEARAEDVQRQTEELLARLPKPLARELEEYLASLAAGDQSACLRHLDAALALEPKAAWIYRLRSRCYDALGVASCAIADLESALKLSPRDAALHQELGSRLFFSKLHDRAAQAFTRALACAKDGKIRILEQRAYARWYAGRPDEALADLQRCLKLDPQCGEYLRLRAARIALSCGKEAYARSVLAAWRRVDKPEMRARAEFLAGLIEMKRRRFSRAAKFFESSERIRAGTYFSGEFPALRYSTLARGLEFMERR